MTTLIDAGKLITEQLAATQSKIVEFAALILQGESCQRISVSFRLAQS